MPVIWWWQTYGLQYIMHTVNTPYYNIQWLLLIQPFSVLKVNIPVPHQVVLLGNVNK